MNDSIHINNVFVLRHLCLDVIGSIDFNEIKRVIGGSFFKEYSKQELQSVFKNPILTEMVLVNWVVMIFEAMVKSLDSNGDGNKISFDEFFKLFD